jgi:hypothetical protein
LQLGIVVVASASRTDVVGSNLGQESILRLLNMQQKQQRG